MKKVASVVLTSFICLSVLSACGGNKNEAESPSASASPSATQQASESAAQPEAQGDSIKLTAFGFKAGAEIGAMDELNAKFEAENPGITVEYEGKPGAEYVALAKTRFASGDAADIVMMHPGAEIAPYAEAGQIVDLTNEPWASEIADKAKEVTTFDGKLYALPNDMAALAVFYNKKIFGDLGIEIPRKWDDLVAAAEKIKASGVIPFSMTNNDGSGAKLALYSMAPSWIYAADQDFDNRLNKGEAKFNGTWNDMLTAFFDLDKKGYFTPQTVGVTYESAMKDFQTGKAAMMVWGNWEYANIKKAAPELDFAMFNLPSKNGDVWASAAVGTTWSVNAKSKNLDAAKKYIAFWAKAENQEIWDKSQSAFATNKNAKPDLEPGLKEIGDAIAAGHFWNFLDQGWKVTAVADKMGPNSQGILGGQINVEQFLQDLDKENTAELSK